MPTWWLIWQRHHLAQAIFFAVSAGLGELSTFTALMQVAKRDGAKVLFFTATPDATAAAMADHGINIPAQTMANDQGTSKSSNLPMGSVYEGSMFMLFEMINLKLQRDTNANSDDMRKRHTNME